MSPEPFDDPRPGADVPPAQAPPATTAADATLSDAWVTIRKRKWLILGCALLGAIYGLYEGVSQVRLYDATGTIEIRNGSSNEYRLSTNSGEMGASSRISTEMVILKSDSLMLAVARDLNLANNPDFFPSPGHYVNIDDPVVRKQIIGSLQGSVAITSIPKTDIIKIDCLTVNPKLSANIINTLVTDYINRSFQSRAEATHRVSNFFSIQLEDLRQEVQTSQEQMLDLQKRLGVLAFDPTHNQITTTLDSLSAAATAAEIARINAETRYHVLSTMDRDALEQTASVTAAGSPIQSIRSQMETTRSALAALDVDLGPNNPKEKALRLQLAELNTELQDEENRVLSSAKQAYLAAKADEDQTLSALDEQKNAAFKLRDDLLDYSVRSREFESNRTLYEGLLQRLRTAGVEAGLESTEIDIIDPAVAPLGPTLKPKGSMIAVDASVMLVMGLILAFILDSLDTGLRSIADVESVSGLPSLALIPRGRRISAVSSNLSPAMRNIGSLTSPKSQFAEAFRALRTSLLLSSAGREPKVILLTSATPSEGKTTVSINLACILAQRNVRVLLIDADLRRPTVHHRFGLNGKIGLTSVLAGQLTLEQAIQTVPEVPMLDVLVSGPVPPFPTEMVGSETMRELIKKCRGIYTHIVMDSPPLLSVTDSVVLARDADAIVMIIRHGKSSRNALRRGRDLLLRSGAQLTGIVLNAVDLNSPEYYSYYGYYGYSGYSAAGVDSAGWEASSKRNEEDEPSDATPSGRTR